MSRLFLVLLFVAQPLVTVASRAILRYGGGTLRHRGYNARTMLLAAQLDDWQGLAGLGDTIANSHAFTLRRVDPATLGRLPPQHGTQS